jgi:hypothetical protein
MTTLQTSLSLMMKPCTSCTMAEGKSTGWWDIGVPFTESLPEVDALIISSGDGSQTS